MHFVPFAVYSRKVCGLTAKVLWRGNPGHIVGDDCDKFAKDEILKRGAGTGGNGGGERHSLESAFKLGCVGEDSLG